MWFGVVSGVLEELYTISGSLWIMGECLADHHTYTADDTTHLLFFYWYTTSRYTTIPFPLVSRPNLKELSPAQFESVFWLMGSTMEVIRTKFQKSTSVPLKILGASKILVHQN